MNVGQLFLDFLQVKATDARIQALPAGTEFVLAQSTQLVPFPIVGSNNLVNQGANPWSYQIVWRDADGKEVEIQSGTIASGNSDSWDPELTPLNGEKLLIRTTAGDPTKVLLSSSLVETAFPTVWIETNVTVSGKTIFEPPPGKTGAILYLAMASTYAAAVTADVNITTQDGQDLPGGSITYTPGSGPEAGPVGSFLNIPHGAKINAKLTAQPVGEGRVFFQTYVLLLDAKNLAE